MRIEIPEFSLVALIGATSSGKTTFAKKHFMQTEILSSDVFRGMVSDDENDQEASKDAFELLYHAAEKRLNRMKLTVIDATNVQAAARKQIIELARKQNVHSVAIVLNLPEKELLARNAARSDRKYPEQVVRRHAFDLRRSMKNLKKEGFRYVYFLDTPEAVEGVEIVRTRLWNDKRDEHGPFDIIGDVHGCLDELVLLLHKLGYKEDETAGMLHPEGRKPVFLGDLCDRGPKNAEVLRLVLKMVKSGNALAVPGNHDVKLARYLLGKTVRHSKSLDQTISELEKEDESFRKEVGVFLDGLVSHYVLDGGKLAVSHAGLKEEYIGRGSKTVRDFCLYGEITGESDAFGLPVRLDWAADYRGTTEIVYGHTPHRNVQTVNRTTCIDTGCVFGGKLTAYRYPEKEIVDVHALAQYETPAKPLSSENRPSDDMLSITDVQGKLHLCTELMPSITVQEANTAAALEVMSRFAADPRWLIYLPPTMSPCETSPLEGYLEHPLEAFAYYRNHGVRNVICEKKHMGSRAVIVLCRTTETAASQFGIDDGTRGIMYTRTGRRFFDDISVEAAVLTRLDTALSKTNFWQDFKTDWVCLDAELMPWSEKARGLITAQYAPVGRAGRDGLAAAVQALQETCQRENLPFEMEQKTSGQNVDPAGLLKRYTEKLHDIEQYTDAYRAYCWSVNSVDDLRIAPFHLLASEGKVFSKEKHVWHMETLK